MKERNLSTQLMLIVCLGLLVVLIASACAEKTSGPPSQTFTLTGDKVITIPAYGFEFPDEVVEVIAEAFCSGSTTLCDVSAVPMSFIVKTLGELVEDTPNLFTFRITAADGYNPYDNGGQKPDLQWYDIEQGYLLLIDPYRAYFPAYSQLSDPIYTYNVKDFAYLCLYRTIVVEKPNYEEDLYHIKRMTTYTIDNHNNEPETAIKLSDLINITNPDKYIYNIYSADGTVSNVDFAWEHIQDGYYLLESDRTFFPNYNISGQYRWKEVVRIKVRSEE